MSLRHAIAGTLAMLAAIAGVAVLSAWPAYRTIPPGTGVLMLSISHGGQRTCRELTGAELAKLPPNMRRTEVCERRRQPVYLELEIDGALAFARSIPPSGIAGDGASRVHERFLLPAGPHALAVRLRDSARAEGFDAEAARRIELAATGIVVIDFDAAAGGFVFP